MKAYPNLPWEQQRVQPLAGQFNADERLRRALEIKRCEKRLRYPSLTRAQRKVLDLLDSVITTSLKDCIGFFENR